MLAAVGQEQEQLAALVQRHIVMQEDVADAKTGLRPAGIAHRKLFVFLVFFLCVLCELCGKKNITTEITEDTEIKKLCTKGVEKFYTFSSAFSSTFSSSKCSIRCSATRELPL